MGHSSFFLGLSCSALLAVSLLACGGSQPAPAAPTEPAAVPSAEAPVAGASDVWSDTLSDKDKAAFMKKKVVPPMTKTFQDYDAKKYAEVGCKTCHGPTFKPHPADFLPELHMKGQGLAEMETKPDMVKFMHEKVAPQMAEILGKKPYDPATKEGFGCTGCHKINM
jgi:hypothetical protein